MASFQEGVVLMAGGYRRGDVRHCPVAGLGVWLVALVVCPEGLREWPVPCRMSRVIAVLWRDVPRGLGEQLGRPATPSTMDGTRSIFRYFGWCQFCAGRPA